MATTCHGLTKSTIGYPCAHDFLTRGTRALCKDDFSQHWWLDVPVELNVYPAAVSMEGALTRYREEYVNEPSAARNHLLVRHLLEMPAANTTENPIHIQGRGRPSDSTQRQPSAFEYV